MDLNMNFKSVSNRDQWIILDQGVSLLDQWGFDLD